MPRELLLRPKKGIRHSAKEGAYASLRAAILSGTLKGGSALPERQLAEQYRLSRTPMREILQRLQYEGLIELIPNRGAFVCQFTAGQLADIFWAREAVEGVATRLAASRHDVAALYVVQQVFAKVKIEDRPESLARMSEAGHRLHDFIVDAAGNDFLRNAYDALRNKAMLVRSVTRWVFPLEQASYYEHLQIIEAVRHRDADAAESAMRAHLRSTRERMITQMLR